MGVNIVYDFKTCIMDKETKDENTTTNPEDNPEDEKDKVSNVDKEDDSDNLEDKPEISNDSNNVREAKVIHNVNKEVSSGAQVEADPECTSFIDCALDYINDTGILEGQFNPNPHPENLPAAKEKFQSVAQFPPLPTSTVSAQVQAFTKGLAYRNMAYTYIALSLLFLILILVLYFTRTINFIISMYILLAALFIMYFVFISFRVTTMIWVNENINDLTNTIETFEDEVVEALPRVPQAIGQSLCVYEGHTMCMTSSQASNMVDGQTSLTCTTCNSDIKKDTTNNKDITNVKDINIQKDVKNKDTTINVDKSNVNRGNTGYVDIISV